MDGDAEIRQLLWLLEHGTASEKIKARTRLGRICEQRGMWDYAAECYETNIRAGVRDPDQLYRLATAYLRASRVQNAIRTHVAQFRAWLPSPIHVEGNRLAVLLAVVAVALAAWAAFRPAPPPQHVTTIVSATAPASPPQSALSVPSGILDRSRPRDPDPIAWWWQEQEDRRARAAALEAEARAHALEGRVRDLEQQRRQEQDRQWVNSLFERNPTGSTSGRCSWFRDC